MAAFFALAVMACGSVSESDPSFWTPSQDLGGGQLLPGGGGAAGDASGGASFGGEAGVGNQTGTGGFSNGGTGAGTNSGACTFHFDFTTVTANGKYSPKNIGAVWIETPQGQFVKSLNVWAAKRIIHLVKWNAVSGGNQVDAITSATAPSHGMHTADWNCTDLNGNAVPDGPYRLMLEMTEQDSAFLIWPPGPSFSIEFAKGGQTTFNPPNQPNFMSMTLSVN
jgi:hypothetical protein